MVSALTEGTPLRRDEGAGDGTFGLPSCGGRPSIQVVNEPPSDFESVVNRYYADVYRFALSLARQSADAADLTQETFLRFAQKGGQIREVGQTKSWLMTTVFREYNGQRRRAIRFPHASLDASEGELPSVGPRVIETLDGATVMDALGHLDEPFRAPLALFFLEDFSYQEIAEILAIPIGTVMSRLSRGKAQMKRALRDKAHQDLGDRPRILRIPQQNH